MAEFLVYNKEHWMDALSPMEVAVRIANDSRFKEAYDTRDRKGDVIEVRPDGFWTDGKRKGFGAAKGFALLVVPGLKAETAKKYQRELYDDPTLPNRERKLLNNHRYNVRIAQVTLSADKKATFTNVANIPLTDRLSALEIE